jgi:tetratricopeptide (TPR) repeat protein
MGSKCSRCTEQEKDPIPDPALNLFSLQADPANSGSFGSPSLDDSLLTLDKIISKSPENPDLLSKIALHLYEKGLFSQSFDYFTQLENQATPFSPQASFIFAQLLARYKNFDKAIEVLLRSLEQQPGQHKCHAFLGDIYAELEMAEESMTHISEALKLKEDVAEYHNSYGLCMMKKRQFSDALTHFLRAFELDPLMAKSLNNAGNAFRKLGNTSEAIKSYNAAINLTPKRKFPIALINLATACFYTGDIISTLTYFEEALQTGSNIHKIMVKKGYHLLFKNTKTKYAIELIYKLEFYRAAQLLADILSSDPNNPVLHYYKATALSKLNKHVEATDSFKAVIE